MYFAQLIKTPCWPFVKSFLNAEEEIINYLSIFGLFDSCDDKKSVVVTKK